MEIIGWLSSFFLGACGVPQAYFSWKRGRADDISWTFLLMWIFGEISGSIYVLSFIKIPWPIFVNYIVNIIVISIILKYKIKPKADLTLKAEKGIINVEKEKL